MMYDKPNRDCERQDDPSFCVECYAGHRADTEPRYLHIGQRVVAVTEIIDRWLDPTHRYFKLRPRMLGLEQLHYYDIYPPLVSLDKTFDARLLRRLLGYVVPYRGTAVAAAADVTDDRHANAQQGDLIWDGDALQMGLVTAKKIHWNIGLALTKQGVVFHHRQTLSIEHLVGVFVCWCV